MPRSNNMVADVAYLEQSLHNSQQQLSQLQQSFALQRQAFKANPMPSAEQRIQWLNSLRDLLSNERDALIRAISQDFSNRSADETLLAELMPSLHGIHYATKRIKKWMKPSRRSVGLQFMPASAKVISQPLGVVGVIVPWNYPLFLAIGPLVGALAAGNRVMIKMSESTPATSQLVKDLLAKVFPEDLVTVELGGKSPAIVSASVPLSDAAERIAFGKTMNAGQTCVAPDYVLVPKDRVAGFVEAYRKAVQSFYPTLANNPDYTAIINERQQQRQRRVEAGHREQGCDHHPTVPRSPGPAHAAGRAA